MYVLTKLKGLGGEVNAYTTYPYKESLVRNLG